jgi:hypothetical protein
MTNTAPARLLSHMSGNANFNAWIIRLPEWKSSRRKPRGELTGDVSNRRPQILDRQREGSETDLSRMIPQLASLLYCIVLYCMYSTCLTYGDGDEIEYASREVKQKSCLSAVVNAHLPLLSLSSRLSPLNRSLELVLEIWPSHVIAEAKAEATKKQGFAPD